LIVKTLPFSGCLSILMEGSPAGPQLFLVPLRSSADDNVMIDVGRYRPNCHPILGNTGSGKQNNASTRENQGDGSSPICVQAYIIRLHSPYP